LIGDVFSGKIPLPNPADYNRELVAAMRLQLATLLDLKFQDLEAERQDYWRCSTEYANTWRVQLGGLLHEAFSWLALLALRGGGRHKSLGMGEIKLDAHGVADHLRVY
jgi:hypothetical protein